MSKVQYQCSCKVGRVIDRFEIPDINEDLIARRSGDAGTTASLRDLAQYFNQRVIRTALEQAGETPLDGEVENTYRLLTADDVSRGTRIRMRNRLENHGIDPDDLQKQFVSHPTIGKHLSNCLDIEPARETRDRIEVANERIFKMQSRTEAVINNTLSGLASAGYVGNGEFTVSIDISVICEECGEHGEVGEFVARGGCNCANGEAA